MRCRASGRAAACAARKQTAIRWLAGHDSASLARRIYGHHAEARGPRAHLGRGSLARPSLAPLRSPQLVGMYVFLLSLPRRRRTPSIARRTPSAPTSWCIAPTWAYAPCQGSRLAGLLSIVQPHVVESVCRGEPTQSSRYTGMPSAARAQRFTKCCARSAQVLIQGRC